MKTITLNRKDLLELVYWADPAHVKEETEAQPLYLKAFRVTDDMRFGNVLEIGCGPLFGMLPLINAKRKTGVDPLLNAYRLAGLRVDSDPHTHRVSECFESWADGSPERFDAIFSANALDHGEMDFSVIPLISNLLRPDGLFFLHVHLRPKDLLNIIHDHGLQVEDLEAQIAGTGLRKVSMEVLPKDVTGWECPTLIGVWKSIA